MRLLVVEDEPKIARLIRTALQDQGHAIDAVDNGREAVWMATECEYDAIVLDAGADDYLPKPFCFDELSARLRALMRRRVTERPTQLVVGDLTLDPATRRVTRSETVVRLSPKGFSLLELFMRRPGEVLSRAVLLEHAWDFAYEGDSNVVRRVHPVPSRHDRPSVRPGVDRDRLGSGLPAEPVMTRPVISVAAVP